MNKAQELTQRIDILEKAKCPKCGEMTKMGSCKTSCNSMEKGDKGEKDKYCMKNFGKKYSECSEKQKTQCDKHCDKNSMEKQFSIADSLAQDAGKVEPGEFMPGRNMPKFKPGEEANPMGEAAELGGKDEKPEKEISTKPSEGKPRKQKRGEAGRGVKVKRPGFRGSPMPLTDESATGNKMEKAVAEGSQPGFTTAYDSTPQGVMFMSETGGQTRNAYYTTNQYPYNAEDVANKGATSVQVSLDKLASMLNPHEGGGVSRLDDGGVLRDNPY
jgi:hypothetical protein